MLLSKALILLLSLVFALAACGGSPDEAPEAADTPEDDVAEADGDSDEADPEPAPTEEPEERELIPIRLAFAASSFNPGDSPETSLALELGYWEEEGLDVEVLPAGGSPGSLQHVEAGQAEVGLAAPSSLVPAVAAGLDVLAYYNQLSGNVFVPEVPEDSDIQTLADFEGKTVGVSSLESTAQPLLRGLMVAEGHDPDTLTFVPVGLGVEAYNFAVRGEVDVLALFDTAYGEIENLGFPLRPVAPDWFSDLTFHQAIFTSREQLESNPDAMVGIARGIAKARIFANENPEAAVRIHWKEYPASRPAGVSEDEALEQAMRVLERRNQHTARRGDAPWGHAEDEEIEAIMDFYVMAGILEERLEVDEVWTPDYLDEINDFDEEALRAEARAYVFEE